MTFLSRVGLTTQHPQRPMTAVMMEKRTESEPRGTPHHEVADEMRKTGVRIKTGDRQGRGIVSRNHQWIESGRWRRAHWLWVVWSGRPRCGRGGDPSRTTWGSRGGRCEAEGEQSGKTIEDKKPSVNRKMCRCDRGRWQRTRRRIRNASAHMLAAGRTRAKAGKQVSQRMALRETSRVWAASRPAIQTVHLQDSHLEAEESLELCEAISEDGVPRPRRVPVPLEPTEQEEHQPREEQQRERKQEQPSCCCVCPEGDAVEVVVQRRGEGRSVEVLELNRLLVQRLGRLRGRRRRCSGGGASGGERRSVRHWERRVGAGDGRCEMSQTRGRGGRGNSRARSWVRHRPRFISCISSLSSIRSKMQSIRLE